MDDLRRLPLEVRVARFIHRALAKAMNHNGRQEDLAFTFRVSRVSMGEVLKKLEGSGLIEIDYGRIKVPIFKDLEEWLLERTLVTPLFPNSRT